MWQYIIPAISAIVVAALTSGGLRALGHVTAAWEVVTT